MIGFIKCIIQEERYTTIKIFTTYIRVMIRFRIYDDRIYDEIKIDWGNKVDQISYDNQTL